MCIYIYVYIYIYVDRERGGPEFEGRFRAFVGLAPA